mmetsp:Transcript_22024/g.65230  ORF Transcript_22024/g.65230 Transcript_22024/m.65230 type:complete len:232 (-) Transcript_22024:80-775(-)
MTYEERVQIRKVGIVPLETVEGNGIGDRLDHASPIGQGHNLVGVQPRRDVGAGQYRRHATYQLGGELLLTQIVVRFDKDGEETPPGVRAEGGLRAEAFLLGGPILLEDDVGGTGGFLGLLLLLCAFALGGRPFFRVDATAGRSILSPTIGKIDHEQIVGDNLVREERGGADILLSRGGGGGRKGPPIFFLLVPARYWDLVPVVDGTRPLPHGRRRGGRTRGVRGGGGRRRR